MAFFDSAQDQCSDIDYDLLNSEKLHDTHIYNSAKWDSLRVNCINNDITFLEKTKFGANKKKYMC